ncbi:MAG: hypothetical protein LBC87_04680 [Fibromonadaceae bacterium]|jgi:hypothetical protein|nr:hypothetical protein [Fibromonadaceae bacterium]
MKGYRILILFFFLFCSISQATTCNALRKAYQNQPSNIYEKQMFLDSNVIFSPFEVCYDVKPEDFKIDSLSEKVEMGFIERNILSAIFSLSPSKVFHYNCIFRAVRIDYTVKCKNNLQYRGVEYLLSRTREENESTDIFGTTKKDMEDEVHGWIKIPLDYLKADGSITKDPVTSKEWRDKPAKLNIPAILKRWIEQAVSIPKYIFTGTPGKLPRPVLFVHGFNSATVNGASCL